MIELFTLTIEPDVLPQYHKKSRKFTQCMSQKSRKFTQCMSLMYMNNFAFI